MFMSLFSSFDALCAESFGHKFSLSRSWAPDSKQTGASSSSSSVGDGANKAGDGSATVPQRSSSPSYPKKPENHQQSLSRKPRIGPRFAVELDGVHCFETIIPS